VFEQLRYLSPHFRPYKGRLVAGMASILASVVIGLCAPLLVGWAVDSLRREVSSRTLLGYAALLVGIALVQGIFNYLQRMILVTLSRDVEFDLRNRYFAKLEELSLGFFQRHATGDLMARATNDLQAVRMLCGPAIMYSSNTVFTATGALVLMARIDVRLTLLALATMPLVAYATKVFGTRIHVLFEQVQESFSNLSTQVQENFSGVRVLRAYAREEAAIADFRRVNDDYVDRNEKLIRWNAAFHPVLQALVGVGFVGVLWYGGLLVTRGAITVGEFVTFNLFLGKLIWPMIAIGWVINLAQRGAASMGRIRRVLESEPEVADRPGVVERPPPVVGEVLIRHLDFAYPRPAGEGAGAPPPVLAGIDLTVRAGETVALVGRTGSGKSTLLSLLPRLIDPPAGTVFVDGVDVLDLPLAHLRAAIGIVPQETFLFSTTVADNIALGSPGAGRDEIAEAARLAGLEPDVAGFPQGLETLVGERGITLSGGQKQRVALARAILRRPRILILDDCLSAVDTHTEETILGNLREVFVGRTVLLVSHRISTVKDADQILVLDDGRVLERGSHRELVAGGGLYADLDRRQQLEEELAAV
jgi:ATP-binding cassette, subfamily B, multidrug efflux pump